MTTPTTVTDRVTRRPRGRWGVRLPKGSLVSLGRYVAAWRALRSLPPDAHVRGWDHFPTPAGDVLRKMRAGLHDRINVHLPWWGKGRKWENTWQWDAHRCAREVNTSRLVVRWVPKDLRKRLAHRITEGE